MLSNFVKSYKGKSAFRHTTTVRHNGTVIAFALSSDHKIFYSVLDLSEQPNKGPLDVNYWQDNPQELLFPNEIVTVGEGLFNPRMMPVYKKGSSQPEEEGLRVKDKEKDLFRSTTASLSANVPFHVLSDNKYVYVFRQSMANDSVGLDEGTLLVDRFLLSGTSLRPKREVRFQRSRNKYRPQSRKDGLGAKDMEKQPFFEPTQKLEFIRNLTDGRFTGLLLPTQVAGVQRWQFFAYNHKTKMVDSFNIQRGSDGLFNLKGKQTFTCPDHPEVFLTQGGACPEPALADPEKNCPLELVRINSKEGYAEWALDFDGSDDFISLDESLPSGYQTIEMWLKPGDFGSPQNLLTVPNQESGSIVLETDGSLHYFYSVDGNATTPPQIFSSDAALETGQWYHASLVRDADAGILAWYINGKQANSLSDVADAAPLPVGMIFGSGSKGNFKGHLDEVRIWRRPRIQEEIAEDMRHRLTGQEPGLMLYWRFDEGRGNTANDQTENALHGIIHGDISWIESDAPVGDHPGIRRTSFRFNGRDVVSGMTALLYYQQKKGKSGYDEKEKPLKVNSRVMLAVATHPQTGGEAGKNHVAVLDFALSREGKLAQIPDNINLKDIETGDLGRTSREIQISIEQLEQLIHKLEGNLEYPEDQPFLDAVFQKPGSGAEAKIIHFVKDNVTTKWDDGKIEYAAIDPFPPRTISTADWRYDSGEICEFEKTAAGATVTNPEKGREARRDELIELIEERKGNIENPENQPFLDAVSWQHATGTTESAVVFRKGNITIKRSTRGTTFDRIEPAPPKTLAAASWIYASGAMAEFEKTTESATVSAVEKATGISNEKRIGTKEWLNAWTDWQNGDNAAEAAFVLNNRYYYFKGNKLKVFDTTTRHFTEPAAINPAVFPDLWLDGVDAAFHHKDENTVYFFKGLAYKKYTQSSANHPFVLEAQGKINDIFPDVPFMFIHPEYQGDIPSLDELEQELADWQEATIGTDEWISAWVNWDNPTGGEEAAFALTNEFYYLNGNKYKIFDASTRQFEGPFDIDASIFPGLWNDGVDAAFYHRDENTVYAFKRLSYKSYQPLGSGKRFSPLNEGKIHDVFSDIPFLFTHSEYNGVLPNLSEKKEELDALRDDLADAQRRELDNLQFEVEMHMVHTDPFGLTTMGGLLTFAWSAHTPRLFDSANGKLALYFQGANDQFYVTYYDTMTGPVSFETETDKNSIVYFTPRDVVPVKESLIQIEGDEDDICTVKLDNPAINLKETWKNVPRKATKFANVLNGLGALMPFGRLAQSLSGTVNSIKIRGADPDIIKPGNLLVFGAETASANDIIPLTAMDFDGTDDFVELPDAVIGDRGTIQMWIKIEDLDKTQTLFDASTPQSGTAKFFYLDLKHGHLKFAMEDIADSNFIVKTNLRSHCPENSWLHLAAVWNYKSRHIMRLYVNGKVVDRWTGKSGGRPKFLNPYIGKSRSGYITNGMFGGQIAEITIQDTVIKATDVKKNFEMGILRMDPEPLLGSWRFRLVNGHAAAVDFSSNKKNGTVHGTPVLSEIESDTILVLISALELTQKIAEEEPVQIDYDYEGNTIFNHRGKENRSLLYTVNALEAEGNILNNSLSGSGASSPVSRWIAYAQGSALEFHGGDSDEVKLSNNSKLGDFDVEGDLTLEAWVRPEPVVNQNFYSVIDHKSASSRYMLGLQRKPLKSAFHFNADRTAKADAWAAKQWWHYFWGSNWAVAAADAAKKAYAERQNRDTVVEAARRAAQNAITNRWFFWEHATDFVRWHVGEIAADWAASWFDTTPDYLECRNNSLDNPVLQAKTIELWFNVDQKDLQRILYHKPSVYLAAVKDGYFQFKWGPDDDGWIKVVNFPVAPGQWYHAAVTCDGNELRVYKDGHEVLTRKQRGDMPNNNNKLYVGDSRFEGVIDELRIWNVVRSENDILKNMNRRLRENLDNLAGYWHFEESLARDYSGYENHGIVKGSPVNVNSIIPGYAVTAGIGSMIEASFSETYIRSKDVIPFFDWNHLSTVYNASYALRFADDEAILDCGNNASLNLGEDLSIEVFLRLDNLRQAYGLLSKGEVKPAYSLYINPKGVLVFSFTDDEGGENVFTADDTSALKPGISYRIAVTRRHKSETRDRVEKRSINGELVDIIIPEVQEWDDIEFHICKWNGKSYERHFVDAQKYGGPKPTTNTEKLVIGRASSRNSNPLKGIISEVRIWNRALERLESCQNIIGAESGLISWWRLDENKGFSAEDVTGTNHASINLAEWLQNPDPEGSFFRILHNGAYMETTTASEPVHVNRNGFSLGSLPNNAPSYGYKGSLEELRIWHTVRTQEQIQDNLFLRLLGEKEDLIAYYTFDQTFDQREENVLKDHSFRGNDLHIKGAVFTVSDAPISYDTFKVRNALLAVKTDFHDRIHCQPGIDEYGDLQYDAEGNLIGILKRCYSYIKDDEWFLITGYKVGNLLTEWIGQVQFNPELKGFIEGAPPVPSENLTAGPLDPGDSNLSGVATVEVVEADSVTYNYATSKEAGLSASFGLSAQFGVDTTVLMITAPLGIGTATEVADVNVLVGLEGKFDASAGWSSENAVGIGKNLTKSTRVSLNGNWEDPSRQLNNAMRQRYQPSNMGFALVQSETADVFALRLEHNFALVSFQFRPNPDIPKDWNIIPFPINPRYTKQGTLDGAVGYDERGKVLDPDYPNARDYGQHSYFKPKEAYSIKNRITREEQELANYFRGMSTSLGGAPDLAISAGLGLISGAAGGATQAIEGLVSALGSSGLPEKLGKQNMANTYVWTADGGFFAETTETMAMKQETTGGTFSFSGEVGTAIGVDFSVGSVDVSLGFSAMLGGSLNLTKTKTKESENSFNIDIELDVPGDLQAYDENLNREYDSEGRPVIAPGKVDAYRFMTFYLEPSNDNFDTFFNSIVDPIWLQGNHPNALALQQAQQTKKKPPCWRVMHRVTFVSRILPEIPAASAPPLEKKMKSANVESNWQLIKKLDPFVRNKTANFIEFSDAIRQAVKSYLPELNENIEEITEYLSAYYQVYDE